MPHCIMEFSGDMQQSEEILNSLQDLNRIMKESDLFEARSIKTRAIAVSQYLVGGEILPFIHLTVKLLKGRDDEVKRILSNSLLLALCNSFPEIRNITVEMSDLDTNSYRSRKSKYEPIQA